MFQVIEDSELEAMRGRVAAAVDGTSLTISEEERLMLVKWGRENGVKPGAWKVCRNGE